LDENSIFQTLLNNVKEWRATLECTKLSILPEKTVLLEEAPTKITLKTISTGTTFKIITVSNLIKLYVTARGCLTPAKDDQYRWSSPDRTRQDASLYQSIADNCDQFYIKGKNLTNIIWSFFFMTQVIKVNVYLLLPRFKLKQNKKRKLLCKLTQL
jgi:hypothetical protein